MALSALQAAYPHVVRRMQTLVLANPPFDCKTKLRGVLAGVRMDATQDDMHTRAG